MKFPVRLLILAILAILPFGGHAQQNKMPDFQFLDTENATVTKKEIPKGKALLLIYFRSDCDHCVHTAMQLKATVSKYPARIWMVSGEAISVLQNFESMQGLYDFDNLKVLQDNKHQMHKYYDFVKLPFIVLYSPSGKLLKTFEALPSAEIVRKILNSK
jgi:peroxiredoxin